MTDPYRWRGDRACGRGLWPPSLVRSFTQVVYSTFDSLVEFFCGGSPHLISLILPTTEKTEIRCLARLEPRIYLFEILRLNR